MKFSKEQLDNFLFHQRPFTVKVDGIWRAAMGVYLSPIKDPVSVKCIVNGKEVVFVPNNYVDYEGCSLKELDAEVIRLNIATLPPPKAKKPPVLRQRGNYVVNFDWATPITAPLAPPVPPPDNTNE